MPLLSESEKQQLYQRISNNQTPENLDLSNSGINDNDIGTIMNNLRVDNNSTRRLNLSNNLLRNTGARIIAFILESPSGGGPLERDLIELNLNGNPAITDQSLLTRIQTAINANIALQSSQSPSRAPTDSPSSQAPALPPSSQSPTSSPSANSQSPTDSPSKQPLTNSPNSQAPSASANSQSPSAAPSNSQQAPTDSPDSQPPSAAPSNSQQAPTDSPDSQPPSVAPSNSQQAPTDSSNSQPPSVAPSNSQQAPTDSSNSQPPSVAPSNSQQAPTDSPDSQPPSAAPSNSQQAPTTDSSNSQAPSASANSQSPSAAPSNSQQAPTGSPSSQAPFASQPPTIPPTFLNNTNTIAPLITPAVGQLSNSDPSSNSSGGETLVLYMSCGIAALLVVFVTVIVVLIKRLNTNKDEKMALSSPLRFNNPAYVHNPNPNKKPITEKNLNSGFYEDIVNNPKAGLYEENSYEIPVSDGYVDIDDREEYNPNSALYDKASGDPALYDEASAGDPALYDKASGNPALYDEASTTPASTKYLKQFGFEVPADEDSSLYNNLEPGGDLKEFGF